MLIETPVSYTHLDVYKRQIPMFAQMGIAPDVAQCAFRIGDSSTNAITPFLFYMPLVQMCIRDRTYCIKNIFLSNLSEIFVDLLSENS